MIWHWWHSLFFFVLWMFFFPLVDCWFFFCLALLALSGLFFQFFSDEKYFSCVGLVLFWFGSFSLSWCLFLRLLQQRWATTKFKGTLRNSWKNGLTFQFECVNNSQIRTFNSNSIQLETTKSSQFLFQLFSRLSCLFMFCLEFVERNFRLNENEICLHWQRETKTKTKATARSSFRNLFLTKNYMSTILLSVFKPTKHTKTTNTWIVVDLASFSNSMNKKCIFETT